MNIAITEGLDLMPPAFEDGLSVWSSENGTPGSATYDGAANAAIVPSDQDFGGCLELVKTQSIQKLRWTGDTPIQPGVYLRISARVKAISGVLPALRVAGYAMDAGGSNITTLVQAGPSTTLTSYGEVVEISAIVGSGERSGVDMVWGTDAVKGHFGLDMTGGSGGVVRIDDIVIEDITEAFLREMMDQVDVRDYGAVGDGVTDDRDAFQAADDAAEGRTVVVPPGTYFIGSDLTIQNKVRFEGTVTMATLTTFVLIRNFDLPTYIDAFGDEVLAFKKGYQALIHYADHDAFDLGGRRIEVDAPIDMQAAVADRDSFLIRRVIRNGQFYVTDSTAWDVTSVTSTASYSASNSVELTNVANISQIEPGSLVTGNGVGREVYVKEVNVSAAKLTLSQPLYGPAANQTYTFKRFRYVLDFHGFSNLRRLEIENIEFQMNGYASGVILAREGENIQFKDCMFLKPEHRGITSTGRGCQDLHIDRCQFISNEQSIAATARQSIGFNVNANDSKIRNSRFQRMGTTMVLNGNTHLIVGNHWFQGDEVSHGQRTPGLVLTGINAGTVITGNYIDNCSIEWTNEHDAAPDFNNEFSFGGVTITGNIFLAIDVASNFSWIRLKPMGTGHHIAGLHVTNNVFKCTGGNIDRVETADESVAPLDHWRFRDISFETNAYVGVNQRTLSPAPLQFTQSSNSTVWTLDPSGYLPFGGNARVVTAVVADGEILNGSNQRVYDMPWVKVNQGSEENLIQLVWPVACRGTVYVTTRVDKPF